MKAKKTKSKTPVIKLGSQTLKSNTVKKTVVSKNESKNNNEKIKKVVDFPITTIATNTKRLVDTFGIDIKKLPKDIVIKVNNFLSDFSKFILRPNDASKIPLIMKKDEIASEAIEDWIISNEKHFKRSKLKMLAIKGIKNKQSNSENKSDKNRLTGEVSKEATPLIDYNIYANSGESSFQFNSNDSILDSSKNKPKTPTVSETLEKSMTVIRPENVIKKKKNSKIPDYSLEITNPTGKPLKCVLFGCNVYLLTSNYGSDKGIVIKPFGIKAEYIKALTQSEHKPFKTNRIKIVSENYAQIIQDILISNSDSNGVYEETPLITKSYITNDVKRVLTIDYEMVIDGNSYLQFTVLPKTQVSMLFFSKDIGVDIEEVVPVRIVTVSEIIHLYNSIISCQLQQGLEYVSLRDVDKFSGAIAGQSILVLDKLVGTGMVKVKEYNQEKQIGVSLKHLTISGKVYNVDIKTAIKKSEYKLKNK